MAPNPGLGVGGDSIIGARDISVMQRTMTWISQKTVISEADSHGGFLGTITKRGVKRECHWRITKMAFPHGERQTLRLSDTFMSYIF